MEASLSQQLKWLIKLDLKKKQGDFSYKLDKFFFSNYKHHFLLKTIFSVVLK